MAEIVADGIVLEGQEPNLEEPIAYKAEGPYPGDDAWFYKAPNKGQEPSLEELITTGHVPTAPELRKGADYQTMYPKAISPEEVVRDKCRAIAARHPYMELIVNHSFEAAHRLPGHGGKCARVHGHSYRVRVVVKGGDILSDGIVIDFQVVKDVIDQLDHRYLNDIIRNPTAERTAQWLLKTIPLAVEVRVWEGLGGCSAIARV